MPGFSAPDVWRDGGWDVVIMNPPYVGRKEIPQRYEQAVIDAITMHFGATRDLMILFAERALQLAKPDGGVMSMIFNDSIFTSVEADDFRRSLFDRTAVESIARTKCFEGQAINGGVVITRTGRDGSRPIRWVEGHRRPVEDFAGASAPVTDPPPIGSFTAAGAMEVFVSPSEIYRVLPHRPLFRPSAPAVQLLDRFSSSAGWSIFSQWGPSGWEILSNVRAFERTIQALRTAGFYAKLAPGDWVLLGLVSEGGPGLQTGDDRRFIAAVKGTHIADGHLMFQARLESLTLASSFASEYQSLLRTHGDRELALLALWAVHGGKRPTPLPWPRTGTFRTVALELVRRTSVSRQKRKAGISTPDCWVPFEKGDQSQELENQDGRISRIGAAWDRQNPLVIDWSRDSVALLRRRASTPAAQRPYYRNEHLWFQAGTTWNSLASYLRTRIVPEGSIFGHMAPLIRPLSWVTWLSPLALLALLNADVLDFVLRTFLGSRMHIEVGDIRRLPIPVLADEQRSQLEAFARRAIAARNAGDSGAVGEPLDHIEQDLDDYVRDLYGIARDAELWVVR